MPVSQPKQPTSTLSLAAVCAAEPTCFHCSAFSSCTLSSSAGCIFLFSLRGSAFPSLFSFVTSLITECRAPGDTFLLLPCNYLSYKHRLLPEIRLPYHIRATRRLPIRHTDWDHTLNTLPPRTPQKLPAYTVFGSEICTLEYVASCCPWRREARQRWRDRSIEIAIRAITFPQLRSTCKRTTIHRRSDC